MLRGLRLPHGFTVFFPLDAAGKATLLGRLKARFPEMIL